VELVTAAPVVTACQGCGACLLSCPEHAIRPETRSTTPRGGPVVAGPARLVVRADLCTGCGECVEVCPVDAISFPQADGVR
jgi:ferredoxin